MYQKPLVYISLFALLAYFSVAQSNNLASKVESRDEMVTDSNLLLARIKTNQQEFAIVRQFCGVLPTDPSAQISRKAYCNQKMVEFNGRDADLRAQLQKLSVTVQQLNGEVSAIQRSSVPKK